MKKRPIERREFIKQATMAAAIGLAYRSTRVLGANDRVRLGIIGPGARGQELMREFLNVPNVEFVAAADVYTRRHEEAGRLATGIKTVADHRRLLDMKDLDAVIVASPLHWVRQIPSDCTAANVQWDAFLNGRPRRSFGECVKARRRVANLRHNLHRKALDCDSQRSEGARQR